MLSKKSLDALAGLMGITADELAKNISDEQEVELTIPEGEFLTSDKREKLLDNHGKKRYDAGVKKASKDAFDGKTKDEYLEEYKTQVLEEAKVEPNGEIQKLKDNVETLKSTVSDWKGKYEGLESEMASKKRDLTIQSLIPDIPESIGISKSEATLMYKATREFKEDGIYVDGKLQQNDVAEAISMQTDVKNWFESKGWGKAPAGRGGGAGAGAGGGNENPKTEEEFDQWAKEKGYTVGSQEYNSALMEFAKEAPELLN